MPCARDSGWCDGELCVAGGHFCPNADATNGQRRRIAELATAAGLRPRPVDTLAEADAEIDRLSAAPPPRTGAARLFRLRRGRRP